MSSTSIALYALAHNHDPSNLGDTAFRLYELTSLIEEPIIRCTAERRQDVMVAGWCQALCALADLDADFLPRSLTCAVASWARRNGDSRQRATMARFVDEGGRDDITSMGSSMDRHEPLTLAAQASHTRLYQVRDGPTDAGLWINGATLGSARIPGNL